MLTGRKLPLTLAFAVLVAAAIGAGCKGFFQNPTLSAISIQPPSPQVQVGQSTTLQAWGTYSDNSRSQIKSGVAWTSSGQNSTVDVDPNTGVMTGVNTGGTATITAAAQGLSATAQAIAYLGTVTNFEACTGTFDTGTCPASTWTVSTTGSNLSQNFYARATYNSQTLDLTTASTWTPSTTGITCDSSTSPAICTLTANTATGNYTITVTYGTSDSATINVTVTP